MEYAIRTAGLTKAAGDRVIIEDVSMNVEKGKIYGFLGPNGAGKTTVMKLLTGLWQPTAGSIEWFGERGACRKETLKRIGSVIEYPVFYEKLSAEENLDLHCEYMGYYNKKQIRQTLDMVGLPIGETKPVGKYSLGMRQRLGIARSILTKPELLILDEPINGLDPSGIKEIRQLFKMLSGEYGITLLISSHILGEIEQMADTIGVIHQGRLLEEVSMKDIHAKETNYIELATPHIEKAAYVLTELLQIRDFRVIGDSTIRIFRSESRQPEISRTLILNEVQIDAMNKKQHSLEDYFLAMIGGGERSA